MPSNSFYDNDAKDLLENTKIKEQIERFSDSQYRQIYVLTKPLPMGGTKYDYAGAVALFISGMKPCFIDISGDRELFDEYCDDFLEDIGYLSEKFGYREKVGRTKKIASHFFKFDLNNVEFESLHVKTNVEKRTCDLITSLAVGSINNVSKINLEVDDLLDTVKSKITLFDTDQTEFVYVTPPRKKFVIQGLAGSGKTELMLHKIKEIFSNNPDARIAFTCFNKILASSMRERIPEFFDFMRVERQIDWNNKLFCFHSWGSGRVPTSGMYRYICHCYDLPFGTVSSDSFDNLCKRAISTIKSKGEHKFIFDYTFIDESQDFSESFIELCELVTAKKLYVAGDVFQNIFRFIDEKVTKADLLLKKCYRTDPNNLMFSHALGMGLFEEPVLRWLTDMEWDACGYNYEKKGDVARISRNPLRRFEDLPDRYPSTVIHNLTKEVSISDEIASVIEGILKRHKTATQGDIAVIFVDNDNYVYDEISLLSDKVNSRFSWDVNVSYQSKVTDQGKLFISNVNNAKGLEFPFVICYTKDLRRGTSFRNALYTMMARSFLETHLMVGWSVDKEVLSRVRSGLGFITQNKWMEVRIPPKEEIEKQKTLIIYEETESVDDIVRQYCAERNASPRLAARLACRISEIIDNSDFDKQYILDLLDIEYERNKRL